MLKKIKEYLTVKVVMFFLRSQESQKAKTVNWLNFIIPRSGKLIFMQYKFFTLPLMPSAEQEEELNVFLRTHKVIEIDKQLVHGAMPCWAFSVRYILGKVKNVTKASTAIKVNYAEVLSKDAFIKYEKMRSIRKEIATHLGIPAYAVFTNKELAEIASLELINTNTMQTIEGIGSGKIEKVGNLFLEKYNETHKESLV